ncbi:unnamed protein product [Prunus brigantina]
MGSVEEHHHGDFNEVESGEHSFPPEASDICDFFGDAVVLPRVGDEYQVEVPPLAAISYFINNLSYAKMAGHGFVHFLPSSSSETIKILKEKHDQVTKMELEASLVIERDQAEQDRHKATAAKTQLRLIQEQLAITQGSC